MIKTTTEIDVNGILDLLQGRKIKGKVQDFLRGKDQHHTGTWEKVREYVTEGVRAGALSVEDLLDLVEETEAYGKQHIFLYRAASAEAIAALANPDEVKRILRDMKCEEAFERKEFLQATGEPVLASVKLGDRDFTAKWIERRRWWELVSEDEEKKKTDVYLVKKYKRKEARSVVLLNVNLGTRYVELRIEALQSGNKYKDEVERYTKLARPLLDLESLAKVGLGKAVHRIIQSDEVRHRRGKITCADGTSFDIIAPEKADFTKNEFFVGGSEAVNSEYQGDVVNIYWRPKENQTPFTDEVHTIIYSRNEIAFPTAVSREEAVHVLQRVRSFATGAG